MGEPPANVIENVCVSTVRESGSFIRWSRERIADAVFGKVDAKLQKQ